MLKNTKPNKQSIIHDATSSALVEKAKYIIGLIFELTLEETDGGFDLNKATDAMYDFIDAVK